MPKQKLKIGVLYGGPSAEREVSLVTGKAIAENLDKKKYEVLPIEMTKDGQLLLRTHGQNFIEVPNKKSAQSLTATKTQALNLQNSNEDRQLCDLIFIALHGTYGEDGSVQGMLECLGVPYTGSKVLASALGMDKVRSAAMYQATGLPTPPFVHFNKKDWQKSKTKIVEQIEKLGYPVVVKPTNQGSAVGVSIPKNRRDLTRSIEQTLKKFPILMAQQFIKGKEATCGVLEVNGTLRALPPTHILANFDEFYDYKSKYSPGGSTHICPADFPKNINKQIQELAIRAHQALGCSGMSRTDIFYADDGRLWVIETNTIPGMTPTSLFPEAAAQAGIHFGKMLDSIIESALQ